MALTEGHDGVGSEFTSNHGAGPYDLPEVLPRRQKAVTVEPQQRMPQLCLALMETVPSLAKHRHWSLTTRPGHFPHWP